MSNIIKPGIWWIDPEDPNSEFIVQGHIKGTYPRLFIINKYDLDQDHRHTSTCIVREDIAFKLVKKYWYDEYKFIENNNKTC